MTTLRFITRCAAVLGLTAAFGLSSALAQTPSAIPPGQTGFYRLRLGDFTVTALSDGTVPLPVGQLLTNTTPAEVKRLLAREFLQEPLEISINAYLIDTGTRRVLVDTGAGALFGPLNGGRLLASLRAAGYEPTQIDAVLLTHIHGDHSGGLVNGQQLAFPNAVVYVDQRDVDLWLNPVNRARAAARHQHSFAEAEATVRPVLAAGKLKPFAGNTELWPGIRTVASPGHTPGHSFFIAESRGQQLVFWGDALHVTPVQFAKPAIAMNFDVDSPAAVKQRQQALTAAARQGYWVAAAHISFPGIGHVRTNGTGYDWVPVNYSLNQQPASGK